MEVILLLILQLCFVQSQYSVQDYYMFYPGYRGYGHILSDQPQPSLMSCGISCNLEAHCTAANYHHDNSTCTLMDVVDTQDDYHAEETDVTYLCTGCMDGLTDPIGFWVFIDDIQSLGVTTVGTSFVPAGSGFDVLTFQGHIDSYVAIENKGDLAVSSFTLSMDIFPFTQSDGPLFMWLSAPPATWGWATHIWMLYGKVYVALVHLDGMNTVVFNENHWPVANQWNKVAVAYDASTQFLQVYVNGNIEAYATVSSGPHSTYGKVIIGSWYHFAFYPDERAFNGSMACVKLWNVYRDLTTYRADTLACQYL